MRNVAERFYINESNDRSLLKPDTVSIPINTNLPSLPSTPENDFENHFVFQEEYFAQQIDFDFDVDSYLFDDIDYEDLLDFDESNFLDNLKDELEEGLRIIFEKYRITHEARNAILALLKQNGHPQLPSTTRTLFGGLSKEKLDIKKFDTGEYGHFGIEKYLKNCNLNCLTDIAEVQLDFSVDGLPLVKSSKLCLWPKGCTKCEQIGTRIENTNVFSNKTGDPRTDTSFTLRTDPEHHNKDFR